MERKLKRQGIFVPEETYAKLNKLQSFAFKDGREFKKGEIIVRLLDHDPIIMRYFNKLNDEEG